MPPLRAAKNKEMVVYCRGSYCAFAPEATATRQKELSHSHPRCGLFLMGSSGVAGGSLSFLDSLPPEFGRRPEVSASPSPCIELTARMPGLKRRASSVEHVRHIGVVGFRPPAIAVSSSESDRVLDLCWISVKYPGHSVAICTRCKQGSCSA